jgi:restriction system protein
MPRRRSSLADDLVLCPWWVSAGLAAAAFVFLPAILPAPFRPFSTIVVFVLVGLAIISALRSWQTRSMLNQQTGLESIRALPWKRFEDLLAEAYRRQGFKVEETLGGGADGGVDLVLRRDGEVVLVQCKRWKGEPVRVPTVRELYGVLHDRGASGAKLVATTRFTPDARAFAKGKPIELVDQDSLLQLISGVQTSARIAPPLQSVEVDGDPPACPTCGSEMVRRTARRGPNPGEEFWGCTGYPKCRGTRSIA